MPHIDRKIKLLDSSTVSVSLNAFPWAGYTHEKGGFKLHTLLDSEQDMPSYPHVTTANVPDCKAAWASPWMPRWSS